MTRLLPHPQSARGDVAGIEVQFARGSAGVLTFCYVLRCDLDAVRWPPRAAPARADELWRSTCFEAFIQPEGAAGYLELNFSPSTQWAAYAFDGYRTGMRSVEMAAPQIHTHREAGRFELSAEIAAASLPPNAPLRIGLSAIIESVSGEKSYWALAHPPGQPDFHHSDCFALKITPSERP